MIALIGKLHPLLVHFPIALLMAALLFGVIARVRGGEIKHAIRPLLMFGAFGALAAAGTGWAFAEYGAFFGRAAHTLFWHRWLGIGTAAVALLVLGVFREGRATSTFSLAALGVCAAAVSVTGHFGGELVFGEDHWSLDSIEPGRTPGLDDPKGPKRVRTSAFDTSKLPDKLTYASIEPLLQRSCLRCHDARKRKGNLRLDRKDLAMAGGESGVVIVPGDAKASTLFKLISLPRDHEDYMPSKGEPLTDEEVAVIGRWIDQGADW